MADLEIKEGNSSTGAIGLAYPYISLTKVLKFVPGRSSANTGQGYRTCDLDRLSYNYVMIKRLRDNALIPLYAHDNDAGMDLYALDECYIEARSSIVIGIGIAIAIHSDYYGRIAPRSGLSIKHRIEPGAGVIDADYRGEIKIHLYNHSGNLYHVLPGDRIAQLIITKKKTVTILVVDEFPSTTTRGTNGFGSTGD